MKVRAIQMGYYQHRRRRIGDEFEMDNALIKKEKDGKIVKPRWIEDAAVPAKADAGTSGPRSPQALSSAAKSVI
jgi:hypothetical protein